MDAEKWLNALRFRSHETESKDGWSRPIVSEESLLDLIEVFGEDDGVTTNLVSQMIAVIHSLAHQLEEAEAAAGVCPMKAEISKGSAVKPLAGQMELFGEEEDS